MIGSVGEHGKKGWMGWMSRMGWLSWMNWNEALNLKGKSEMGYGIFFQVFNWGITIIPDFSVQFFPLRSFNWEPVRPI